MTHLHSPIIRPPPMNTLRQADDRFSPLTVDLCKMSNGDSHWNDEDWRLNIDQCKMSNGYTFWNDEDWSLNFWNDEDWSLNLADPIFEVAKEPPLLLEDFSSSSSVLSESKKRKRNNLDPGNSQEANGKVTKKQHRCPGTFYTGEPSTSRQQERFKGKTVAGRAKIYKDRISRRIKNDTKADKDVIIWIVCKMMAINASHLLPRVLGSLEQINTQWPIRPDLQHIKQKIQEIESNYKDDSLTDEANRRLVEVGDELERLDQERLKDSTKAGNLDAVFTHVCG
ncbi:hypothetical protein V6Z11_A11G381400 [Gossypium hirsutum]|uniref:Uncharacterized protein isoform X2 n=1 Tax=Gossypium hirsutum TaxID=3635 RepID=A0ABM2Z262_GOSHI|nr:uncharacterized protein LOC121209517 isoform X2 [Gossypium hirsutum]